MFGQHVIRSESTVTISKVYPSCWLSSSMYLSLSPLSRLPNLLITTQLGPSSYLNNTVNILDKEDKAIADNSKHNSKQLKLKMT